LRPILSHFQVDVDGRLIARRLQNQQFLAFLFTKEGGRSLVSAIVRRLLILLIRCPNLLALGGCSGSSSSSDSTETIKGLPPGEYREKAELSREGKKVPSKGKAAPRS
jgi:hypothetical protein